jgi:hypothetical protein
LVASRAGRERPFEIHPTREEDQEGPDRNYELLSKIFESSGKFKVYCDYLMLLSTISFKSR